MSPIWALLAAFDDPLPLPGGGTTAVPFEGAFVKGVDSLSWMGNNTKKLMKSQSGGPHCWTFFSTAAYAKQTKVPQVCRKKEYPVFIFLMLTSMVSEIYIAKQTKVPQVVFS